jgi:Glycosyl transferase family 2
VVDDGSTDDSRATLRAYEGAVELVFKENGGQASALNAGLERCGGDVVMFLDADDVLAPTAASLLAEGFAVNPTAARAYYRMAVIDAAGHPLPGTKPPAHQPMPAGDMRRAALTFPFDFAWVPMSGNGFRASALARIFPVPLEYGRWGADWYLVHLTNLLGPVVFVPEIGAHYRVHGANAHEPRRPLLDMETVRTTIEYQQATLAALSALARELGLSYAEPILSMSNVMHRLISRRLEPRRHPVPEDRALTLLAACGRAAARRYDVSLAMKAALLVWCAGIAVAPRPAAARLSELFLYPESRPQLSRFAGRLQRGAASPVAPASR